MGGKKDILDSRFNAYLEDGTQLSMIPRTSDERLKNGGSVLTVEYFDRLLEQIREIRLSERRFYQKITDIYATALD
ncbi:MAG: virulence RhuM family protein, partial [Lachnobacterium sp.]|nr:virulence RhuM family protein [Lachnobacterium sp.]